MKVVFFHGSPGTTRDFSEVVKELSSLECQSVCRKGYPGFQQTSFSGPRLLVGYSWGCVDALLEAVRNPVDVHGVLMVGPYLFPDRKPSALKKALLELPFLGKFILSKAAPKVVEELLVKTSSPCEVPASYRQAAGFYLDPAILKRAALEKVVKRESVLDALAQARSSAIPVAVVRGEKDKTSSEADQLTELRAAGAVVFENHVSGGGHALLWTHPQEIAQAIHQFIDRKPGGH